METEKGHRPIACTPENASQFREIVKNWPELNSLVKSLQAQDLFPGLRAVRITPLGASNTLGDVLASLKVENALGADLVSGEAL